jgi:hypothetical protein
MRRIRQRLDKGSHPLAPEGELAGWYDGKRTYLWFGIKDGACMGTLQGKALYRFAKRIVRAFEKQ